MSELQVYKLYEYILQKRVFRAAGCACVLSFILVEGVATLIESIDLRYISGCFEERGLWLHIK
jgi:hypothetical protein